MLITPRIHIADPSGNLGVKLIRFARAFGYCYGHCQYGIIILCAKTTPVAEIYLGHLGEEVFESVSRKAKERIDDFELMVEMDFRQPIIARDRSTGIIVWTIFLNEAEMRLDDAKDEPISGHRYCSDGKNNEPRLNQLLCNHLCPNCGAVAGRCRCHERQKKNGPPRRGKWFYHDNDKCWVPIKPLRC